MTITFLKTVYVVSKCCISKYVLKYGTKYENDREGDKSKYVLLTLRVSQIHDTETVCLPPRALDWTEL